MIVHVGFIQKSIILHLAVLEMNTSCRRTLLVRLSHRIAPGTVGSVIHLLTQRQRAWSESKRQRKVCDHLESEELGGVASVKDTV